MNVTFVYTAKTKLTFIVNYCAIVYECERLVFYTY